MVTDRRLASYGAEADPESPTNPQSMPRRDPFNFGHGLKTDAEIAEFRSRKQGKRLASYHRKQNAVGVSCPLFFFPAHTTRIYASAYNISLETHGGTHRRCSERRGSFSLARKRLHIMLAIVLIQYFEKVKIAVRASLIANIVLAVLQS